MAAQEKILNLREVAAAEAIPLVRPAERYGMPGAAAIEDIAARGRNYVVEDGGKVILAYTLQAVGDELFVTAACGDSMIDLCALMAPMLDRQAAEFRSIGFKTTRRGLVRKAQRHGYEIAGYIMRKKLK